MPLCGTLPWRALTDLSLWDSLAKEDKIQSEILDVRHPSVGGLTRALTAFVRSVAGKNSGEVFVLTKLAMIGALQQVVLLDDPAKVPYLSPLIEYARRKSENEPFLIATLNYDRSVELLAEHLAVRRYGS